MAETIEGIYRNGKVELLREPRDAENTRVIVTFLGQPAESTNKHGGTYISKPLPPGPEWDALIKEMFDEMDKGLRVGSPYPTREEIYDRGNRGRSDAD